MYQQQNENGGESEHWIYPMGNLDDMIQTMGFLGMFQTQNQVTRSKELVNVEHTSNSQLKDA